MTRTTFCLAFDRDHRTGGRAHRGPGPVPGPGVGGSPPAGGSVMRHGDGTTHPLDVRAWSAPADPVELRRLDGLDGPVLDVGSGPGRLVVALAERAIPALGVDASPAAVALANERGAPTLRRSVFDPLPGTGRWRAVLLFDGNIGIGGDPAPLLRRVVQLLAPAGRAIVETGRADAGLERYPARIERGDRCTEWFPWASIGAHRLAAVAFDAGLDVHEILCDHGRWFVELRRPR